MSFHLYLFVHQAQQLSAMKLQHKLMKKCEEQMSKQIGELLSQKEHLRERLVGLSLDQYPITYASTLSFCQQNLLLSYKSSCTTKKMLHCSFFLLGFVFIMNMPCT